MMKYGYRDDITPLQVWQNTVTGAALREPRGDRRVLFI